MTNSSCGGAELELCRDESAALVLKFVAIASILLSGMAGIAIPLIGKHRRFLRTDGNLFVAAKAFAAGVILATGFVHMLSDATKALRHPCLPAFPWSKFPFTGFFAMLAALLTLLLDFVGTQYYERKQGMNRAPSEEPVRVGSSEPGGNGKVFGEEESGGMHIVGMHAHAAHHRHNHPHGNDACHGIGNIKEQVHAHSHSHSHSHGHSHSHIEDGEDTDVRHVVVSQVLELGIVSHSVIIGLSLGVSQSPCTIRPLIAALSFHQFFEGFALGGCISQAQFKASSATIMASFSALTTPLGVGIGMGISSGYNPYSTQGKTSTDGTHPRSRPEYIPNHIPDPSYVRILDTTLRDGEQSPGAAMTSDQKLGIARQLVKLGVDIIDAGFPSASQEDFNAVKMIAQEVGNDCDADGYVPVIAALCRCNEKDITTAWEAVRYAKKPRLIPFIATSSIHMEYKLNKTKEEVLQIAIDMVKFTRSLGCDDIEFGVEDAARSDTEFLYKILEEVIKAGATTLCIADTVGITMPLEFGEMIAGIKANVPGVENVIISVHCHNDLGHATANTIQAACVGARQLEVTINGIGERAGNAAFEEVVMALKCRGDHALGGLYTGINTRHILKTSRMVEECSGMYLQPHKALVGDNSFLHESGIHQAGLLKHRGTYEIISPEDIGHERSNGANMVLGKLSGRHALKNRLQELGYELRDDELESVFRNFKAMAGKKKRVTDVDLKALVSDQVCHVEPIWKLDDLQVTCGTMGSSTASVKLVTVHGSTHVACSVGVGPVDAAYKAIDLIVKETVKVLEYTLNPVTEGTDAIATTRIVIRRENNKTLTHALNGNFVYPTFSGTGEGVDVVVSSVEAYLTALNKMLDFKD